MADQQWNGVRQRVAALGTQPTSSKMFGSLGHRWALEDPLADDGLAELEAQTGVRLPDDYRDFLTSVGAGGAGPAYGLFPVRRVQGRWRWEGDGADLVPLLDQAGKPVTFARWYIDWLQEAELTAQQPSTNG
ncbi:SMI1/KNR4 family protein [Streptomyces sp. NPDC094466]|uniref:SMI1/KNR4 family protein n=1 Tax=Streptomyces sp. NPDC094466 TaxID=3366065 RepID=UPI00382803B1